jgi:hypothetical protein
MLLTARFISKPKAARHEKTTFALLYADTPASISSIM